jgi:ADP-ribose pyrophosphatase YjhB (NUDIX family)
MVKRLPHESFLKTFELVPRVAINLLVENQDGNLLLAKRAIPPSPDVWHFPGSFLLKGETIQACLIRIAKDEINLELKGEPELAGVFEDLDKDPRGHVIDVVYRIRLKADISLKPTQETKELHFFKKIPTQIGFNHRETLLKLTHRPE